VRHLLTYIIFMSHLQFHDLAVSKEMHRAIGDLGYVTATEIQHQAIPALLEGKDLVGQAQTGTGKTAAFGIPLIEGIERGNHALQSIVLCPTRELAVQVCEELRKLARYRRDIRIIPIYGGVSIEKQRMELRRGASIVVGTPGRFIDQIERGALKLETVKTVVLDEADEMLNMGFRPNIERIMGLLPKVRQTALFSATMSKDIRDIANRYLNDPTTITIAKKELTAENVEQVYYETLGVNKTALMSAILKNERPDSVMIFCNTKRRVDVVVKKLQQDGYSAEGIHGDFTQRKRSRTMNDFRRGTLTVLVATDVAARGIDISSVTMVINYDLPLDPEYYVHRIGRTGRAGKSGKAITFSHGREEMYRMRSIERFAKTTIELVSLPEEIHVEQNAQEPEPIRRGGKKYAAVEGGESRTRQPNRGDRPRTSYDRGGERRGRSDSERSPYRGDRDARRPDRFAGADDRGGESRGSRFESRDSRPSRDERSSRSESRDSRPSRDERSSRSESRDSRPSRDERSSRSESHDSRPSRDERTQRYDDRDGRSSRRSSAPWKGDDRRASGEHSARRVEKDAPPSRKSSKFGVFKQAKKKKEAYY